MQEIFECRNIFAQGVNSCINRIASRRSLYTEALNPYFGYFYTIKKSLRKPGPDIRILNWWKLIEFGKVLAAG
jgi:hypothetical protein